MTNLFWSLEIWWKSMFFLHIPFGTFGAGQVHREVLSNLLRHPDILVKLKSQLDLIFILLIHQLLVPTFPPFPLPFPLPFTELSTHVSKKQKASHSLMVYHWFFHPLPSTPGWCLWTEPGRRWWGRTAGTSNRSKVERWNSSGSPTLSNPTENGGHSKKKKTRPVATPIASLFWGSDLIGATQPAAAPLRNPVDSVGGLWAALAHHPRTWQWKSGWKSGWDKIHGMNIHGHMAATWLQLWP